MAISQHFRESVLAYKYSSPNLSFLESLYLNQFWELFVKVYPKWLAPNLVTLMGFSCIIVAYGISWVGSPDMRGELPQHLYYLLAFLFFAYQTLDGSDGKQARRTKSGSALGELMDHGVDAITTCLASSLVLDALGFGLRSLWPWGVMISGQIGFYLSNLTLLHNNHQSFFALDIMELQTVMIIALCVTAYGGIQVWRETVDVNGILGTNFTFTTDLNGLLNSYPESVENNDMIDLSKGIEWRVLIAGAGMVGCVSNIFSYLATAYKPYRAAEKLPHIQRGAAGTGVLTLFHQVLVITWHASLNGFSWYLVRTTFSGAHQTDAFRALLLTCSFAFADTMDRVLVMRVAQEKLPTVPPGIQISLVMMCWFFLQAEILKQYPTIANVHAIVPCYWLIACMAIFNHMLYFASRGMAIAEVLGIHPFKVKNWEKLKLN